MAASLSRPVVVLLVGGASLSLFLLARRRWFSGTQPLTADPLWAEYKLSAKDIELFGRQVVLPKLGVDGQVALSKASALIVGAGGLGCPVALFIWAAGLGRMGIVDDDTIALSNLHRQIGHSWRCAGESKAESLRRTCLSIRHTGQLDAYTRRLQDVQSAAELIASFDVIVDCTDSPTSRYLVNDACILAGKPLVAASSVGLSGQVAVYNLEGGPCLRCVYPKQPGAELAETVGSCEEQGVLGPVCGIIGTFAAMEVLKVVGSKALRRSCLSGHILLYDALDDPPFCRTMKICRSTECTACGKHSTSNSSQSTASSCTFCPPVGVLQMTAAEFRAVLSSSVRIVVVDVRPAPHFNVSHLRSAIHWPLAKMLRLEGEALHDQLKKLLTDEEPGDVAVPYRLVCVCRRGNDSVKAVMHLQKAGIRAWSLKGGLLEFRNLTDRVAHELPPLS